MRFVTLGFTGWMLLCASVAAEVTSEADLLDRLSSPNLAERREAARSLDVETIGNLEPQLAVPAVLLAAQDTDPTVREWALGRLGVLAAAAREPAGSAYAALCAQAMPPSSDLRALLERIISEDPSVEVVTARRHLLWCCLDPIPPRRRYFWTAWIANRIPSLKSSYWTG